MAANVDPIPPCTPQDSEESCDSIKNIPKSVENRSKVLQNFNKVGSNEYVCKVCQVINPNITTYITWKKGSSINIFWKHLRKAHRKLFNELKGIDSSNPSAAKNFYTNIILEHCMQKIIRFLCLTDMHLSTVDEAAFREFVHCISQANMAKPRRKNLEEKINRKTLEFVCLSGMPMEALDEKPFREMMQCIAHPDIKIPNADAVRDARKKMYMDKKNEIKQKFDVVPRVSLTVDTWTEKSAWRRCSEPEELWLIVGVTAHWVDSEWKLCKQVLAIREVCGNDTRWMGDIVLDVLDEFGLKSKVFAVTSNISRSKHMMETLAEELKDVNPQFKIEQLVTCPIHVINQTVKAMLNSLNVLPVPIVWAIEGDSENEETEENKKTKLGKAVDSVKVLLRKVCDSKHYAKFLEICKSLGMPAVKWRDDDDWYDLCPAGWNSTFEMLDAALAKREALDKAASTFLNSSTNNFTISLEEWTMLKKLIDILRPFREIMRYFNQSKRMTVKEVIALVTASTRHFSDMMQNFDGRLFSAEEHSKIRSAFEAMNTKLSENATLFLGNKLILIGAFLDPSAKLATINPVGHAEALSFIRGFLNAADEQVNNVSTPNASQSLLTTNFVAKAFQSLKSGGDEQPKIIPTQELDKYLNFPLSEDQDGPLTWWRDVGSLYFPKLTKIAKEFLSVSATSTPSERLSRASQGFIKYKNLELEDGDIPDEGDNIDMLMTLKCWLLAEDGETCNKNDEDGDMVWVEGDW